MRPALDHGQDGADVKATIKQWLREVNDTTRHMTTSLAVLYHRPVSRGSR